MNSNQLYSKTKPQFETLLNTASLSDNRYAFPVFASVSHPSTNELSITHRQRALSAFIVVGEGMWQYQQNNIATKCSYESS